MIAAGRKYKSGTGWCFWRWTEVETEYITRLHVLKTPWFAICVHWLNHPDPDPYLHDHPVTFLSLILRGSYVEQRADGFSLRNRVNVIHATEKHRIVAVDPKTVTLCFMGPKVQEWGFYTGIGRVHWKDYYKLKAEGRV